MRNALITPFTVILLQLNYLVSGLVVVETVFAYPGFGRMMLEAALNKDIAVIEAGTLVRRERDHADAAVRRPRLHGARSEDPRMNDIGRERCPRAAFRCRRHGAEGDSGAGGRLRRASGSHRAGRSLATIGGIIVTFWIVCALLAPWIAPYPPNKMNPPLIADP